MRSKRILISSLLFILILVSCSTKAASTNSQAENTAQIDAAATRSPTITPTLTITPTPAPEYPIIPKIENFLDCYVPVEKLLDGSYWNWLNDVIAPTLIPWFQEHEDKIKDVKLGVIGVPIDRGSAFIYDS